jgi:hypothetical protein
MTREECHRALTVLPKTITTSDPGAISSGHHCPFMAAARGERALQGQLSTGSSFSERICKRGRDIEVCRPRCDRGIFIFSQGMEYSGSIAWGLVQKQEIDFRP